MNRLKRTRQPEKPANLRWDEAFRNDGVVTIRNARRSMVVSIVGLLVVCAIVIWLMLIGRGQFDAVAMTGSVVILISILGPVLFLLWRMQTDGDVVIDREGIQLVDGSLVPWEEILGVRRFGTPRPREVVELHVTEGYFEAMQQRAAFPPRLMNRLNFMMRGGPVLYLPRSLAAKTADLAVWLEDFRLQREAVSAVSTSE